MFGPVKPEHRSAETWRRSHQACSASLPLQSSLLSKTYLKSDHLNGGGSRRGLADGSRCAATGLVGRNRCPPGKELL
jgi:hypothetical protein